MKIYCHTGALKQNPLQIWRKPNIFDYMPWAFQEVLQTNIIYFSILTPGEEKPALLLTVWVLLSSLKCLIWDAKYEAITKVWYLCLNLDVVSLLIKERDCPSRLAPFCWHHARRKQILLIFLSAQSRTTLSETAAGGLIYHLCLVKMIFWAKLFQASRKTGSSVTLIWLCIPPKN